MRLHVPPGTKIVLIDDSDIVLAALKPALAAVGFEVIARSTAVGAQAIILRERPRVVLLDVEMPLMAGDELARAIRSNSALDGTIVILCSSRPEAELRVLAEACGADGWVAKGEPDRVAREAALRAMRPATTLRTTVLIASASPAARVLATELGASTAVVVTDSGHEALRAMLGRTQPECVVLGTDLSDLPAERVWHAAVSSDSTWQRRVIVWDEAGASPSWAAFLPALGAGASLDDLRAALRRAAA